MKKSLMIFCAVFLLIAGMFAISAACVDSDGQNYYEKGNVTKDGAVSIDYCFGSEIREYGCNLQGEPIQWMGSCANGCYEGACISPIMKISSTTNAHGEIWNGANYNTLIKYSDVFGVKYVGKQNPACNSTNMIVKLSNITNAHAESKSGTAYTTPICYGDLTDCQIKTSGDCADIAGGQHKCVVTLSSTTAPYTNSHLAKCNITGSYSTKVCCKSPQTTHSAFCELQATKTACWNNIRNINCTWTPVVNATTGNLTTSNLDGGHCCGEGYFWEPIQRSCQSTGGTGTCNDPWAVDNQDEPARTFSEAKGYYDQYCVRIAPGAGVSIGLYNPVQSY